MQKQTQRPIGMKSLNDDTKRPCCRCSLRSQRICRCTTLSTCNSSSFAMSTGRELCVRQIHIWNSTQVMESPATMLSNINWDCGWPIQVKLSCLKHLLQLVPCCIRICSISHMYQHLHKKQTWVKVEILSVGMTKSMQRIHWSSKPSHP